MAVVGFDFGTTNSLISMVNGDEVITFLDNNRPIPSVVSFEGGKVEVGRKARDKLTSAGLGVHGSVVRSPKTLLGREEQVIEGVRRDPVKIVEYVLTHVRDYARQTNAGRDKSFDRVVATIPVNMDGHRRSLLRQAFRQAGMSVVQFVHEPLAALYGYFRTSQDTADLIRRYEGKLLLVFDWGGGTLDLTLCRVLGGLLVQIANDGTEEVGGDVFDEELRNEVEKRSRLELDLRDNIEVLPDARKRLLHQCEDAKIRLSERTTWNIDVDPYYQDDEHQVLSVNLSRDDLYAVVGHLVRKGIARIERLLEREGYSTSSVELCLATGGMVNMPLVKNRLDELFGPGRVHVSKQSASAIAEGAAWVAHDESRLHLAKNIELALARNSYISLIPAGAEMPAERERRRERFDLYCTDPSDGYGKFSLVAPRRPGPRVPDNDQRRPLCTMLVKVDSKASPFRERLSLEVSIDENLVLTATAWSLNQKGRAAAEVYDLEFALATPGARSPWGSPNLMDMDGRPEPHEPGSLAVRSNIASREDLSLVPGEVLYRDNPFYFRVEQCPPEIQVEEHLYYIPCSICGRFSNDPLCRCISASSINTYLESGARHNKT